MVSTERRAALLGALWGVGHAATLFAVGAVLVLFRARLPPSLANGFELAVAGMLLVLGTRSIMYALRRRPLPAPTGLPRRPFFVGMAHGLAGSGALTALAMA